MALRSEQKPFLEGVALLMGNNKEADISEILEGIARLEQMEDVDSTFSTETIIQSNEQQKIPIHKECDMVLLGSNGTRITSKAANMLNWNDPALCVRTLLKLLFTRDTLGKNTLTGKPSPAFKNKPEKGKLDEAIVQDITSYCLENGKHCTKKFVRTQISHKCAEMARRLRGNKVKTSAKSEFTSASSSSNTEIVRNRNEMDKNCHKMDSGEDSLTDPDIELDRYLLGNHGTKVSKKALEAIDWTVTNKAICKLLMLVFSRETLATRSLSGRPSPAIKCEKVKKALNENMVADIIQYCTKEKNIPVQIIRQKITMKCADECRIKAMREKAAKPKRNSQEIRYNHEQEF